MGRIGGIMLKRIWKQLFQVPSPKNGEQERQQELHKQQLDLNTHALWRRDAGRIQGEEMEVWANWIRIEVRDAAGTLRFERDVNVERKETTINQARLVGGRYLVIERADGATPLDLEVWDFVQCKWSFTLSQYAEVLLHGAHPSLPLVAIELPEGGMGLLNLESNSIEPIAALPWDSAAQQNGASAT
jgi:hypothetical protein